MTPAFIPGEEGALGPYYPCLFLRVCKVHSFVWMKGDVWLVLQERGVGDSRAEILAHFGHYRHFPHFVNMSHHGGLGLMEGKPNFHGSMSNSSAGDDSPKTRILPLLPNETCNILSYCWGMGEDLFYFTPWVERKEPCFFSLSWCKCERFSEF